MMIGGMGGRVVEGGMEGGEVGLVVVEVVMDDGVVVVVIIVVAVVVAEGDGDQSIILLCCSVLLCSCTLARRHVHRGDIMEKGEEVCTALRAVEWKARMHVLVLKAMKKSCLQGSRHLKARGSNQSSPQESKYQQM